MDTINTDQVIETMLAKANVDLSRKLSADVMLLKAPMEQPLDDVIRSEIEGICESRSEGVEQKNLAVIVETNGGFVETVERIVSVFRRHYESVEFFVPNYAYSAGTLLVLSGDKIHMDYYSVLGPIDPQYRSEDGNYVPGMGYIAKFEELLEKVNNPPDGKEDAVRAELAFLIKKFDPAKLFDIEQAIDHAKSLLKDWLPRYKFKDWHHTEGRGLPVDDSLRLARAEQIANVLGNAKRWHSHGRGISIRELGSDEIKLKIENFGDLPDLNSSLRHYHGLFVDYLGKRGMRAALHSSRGMRRFA